MVSSVQSRYSGTAIPRDIFDYAQAGRSCLSMSKPFDPRTNFSKAARRARMSTAVVLAMQPGHRMLKL
jgi:hypothetical protein